MLKINPSKSKWTLFGSQFHLEKSWWLLRTKSNRRVPILETGKSFSRINSTDKCQTWTKYIELVAKAGPRINKESRYLKKSWKNTDIRWYNPIWYIPKSWHTRTSSKACKNKWKADESLWG